MIRMALINNLFKERLRLHSPILASLEKLRLRRNYQVIRSIFYTDATQTSPACIIMLSAHCVASESLRGWLRSFSNSAFSSSSCYAQGFSRCRARALAPASAVSYPPKDARDHYRDSLSALLIIAVC